MKLRNTAPAAMSPPPIEKQEVHNHAPGYASAIFAIFTVVVIAIVLAWFGGVFLVEQMGYRRGGEVLAGWIVWLVAGGLAVVVGGWVFGLWFDRWSQYRLAMEDKRLARLAMVQKLQTSVNYDSRTMAVDEQRRNALIVALMTDALLDGEFNFSVRKAGRKYILPGETDPVGKDSRVVDEALSWLRDNGAIYKNSLTGRFKSIMDVQRALGLPVVVERGER